MTDNETIAATLAAGLLAGQALPDTDDGKARAVRMAVELYVVIRETLSDIQPPPTIV